MTRPPAIEVRGLGARLGESEVLCRISFTVGEGELWTVVGPNGAGKSTLLRVLDGLLSPSAGEVLIRGRPVGRYPRRALARLVSYVPQADTRSLPYPVRAFVEMARYPYLGAWSSVTAADRAAVEHALELTETATLAGRDLGALSGGERQRVLIAAALAQGGEILLLDEPTSFLDYRHQVQVLELLDRLRADGGRTIVVVTHDLNACVARSDVTLALRAGRVVFLGRPEDALTAATLTAIYDAEFELVDRPGRPLPLVVPSGGAR